MQNFKIKINAKFRLAGSNSKPILSFQNSVYLVLFDHKQRSVFFKAFLDACVASLLLSIAEPTGPRSISSSKA